MPDSRSNEQGFILITAIWLLILCGSIAAILLARSLTEATVVATEAEGLRTKLALDSAIETVAADLLINGGSSPFSIVPSERAIEIDGYQVDVSVASEGGKLDLNEGRLESVDRVLGRARWDAGARALFLQRLRGRRQNRMPLTSMDDALRLAAASRPDTAVPCLDEDFTVYSGRQEPDPRFISPTLAAALGEPAARGADRLDSGTPLAIRATIAGAGTRRVIIRVGGMLDRPLLISAWSTGSPCEPGRLASAPQ